MVTFEHLWQALLTFVLALLGWREFERRGARAEMKDAIAAAEADAEAARRGLEGHKLFAAETYARRAEVERMISGSEDRLRAEIREQGAKQLAVLEEIRDRLPARR